MLQFISNKNDPPKKSPLKYRPEMVYGHSYESPREFQGPHSIFLKSSYPNPFLFFEQ